MFIGSREEIARALRLIGAEHCVYAGGWDKAHPFCDCKYGYMGDHRGEQSGCPEIRAAVSVIEAMSDDEWANIARRTGTLSSDLRGVLFPASDVASEERRPQ